MPNQGPQDDPSNLPPFLLMASEFKTEWELPKDGLGGKAVRIGWAAGSFAQQILSEAFPDLVGMFPFERQFRGEAEVSPNGWIAARIHWQPGRQIPMCGNFESEADRTFLHQRLEPFRLRTNRELFDLLGDKWFSSDRFTYVGPISDHHISWPHVQLQLAEWLSRLVEEAIELNAQRVRRAIAPAPSYDLATILPTLWVLECDETNVQGTAFALEDVGLVTCNHSLRVNTRVFQYNTPDQKYPVVVKRRSQHLDLAVLELPVPTTPTLRKGSADNIEQMAHILVMGHPNYRLGDSPATVPGLIVGFRMVSGTRRLLTNAAIVAGTSGGPVLDRDGRVVGVAVTGSDKMSTQNRTEDHACIPVEALELISQ